MAGTRATLRDLRNHGGDVSNRVAAGERVVVKRDGQPVAELRVGPLVAISDAERAARKAVLRRFEAAVDTPPFDDRTARAFNRLAASPRTAARTVRATSHDAMAAAIAVAHGLPLYTANPDAFRGIDGPEVRVVKGAGGG